MVKRVLVTGASHIGKAGVATILYNWGQHFDKEKVVYDYLAQSGLPEKKYQDDIFSKGGKIYVPNFTAKGKITKMLATIQWVNKVLQENKYEIFHINSDSAYLAAIYIIIAKKAHIKHIVVHSHSTMIDDLNKFMRLLKTVMHYFFRGFVRKNADVKLACSREAGKWMFKGDKTTIIPNGIELEQFAFDEEYRNAKRKEFALEDSYVVGCVGRLAYQKNYLFSIRVFQEILKLNPDAVYLIIGEGPERPVLEQYILEHGLEGKVILLGNRFDVNKLLSCMDVFMLPSRFEGLGIVYIEAQASGMPVFASDQVPEEAFITELIHRCSLSDEPKLWAERIASFANAERADVIDQIEQAGFSIQASANILQQIYHKL